MDALSKNLLALTILCVLYLECSGNKNVPELLYSKRSLKPDALKLLAKDFSFYNENEIDSIDSRVFDSSGKVGDALRQVYVYMANKIQYLEERVKTVEDQTLQLLQRLDTVDCSSLEEDSPSGIYTLYLDHRGMRSVRTHCDQGTDGGGWTVILKRIPHEDAKNALNFTRELRDYKIGFGHPEGDFWVGLENIFMWTHNHHYQLRIILTDFENNSAYAHYDNFYIENERNGYKLHVSGYSGDAGDSLGNNGNPDNYTADNMMFSTHDEDRDTSHEINCSAFWGIGGWWYNRCSWANLMGPYMLPGTGEGIGINWHKWRNQEYIKSAVMMIRRAV